MLKIYLYNGGAFTSCVEVEGSLQDDLGELLDEYYYEHGDLPVKLFKPSELSEEDMAEMLPINGGEYYIEGISHVIEF